MTAPWSGVPLPGGNAAPSGPMLISHSARSASVTGLPSPGRSAAMAVDASPRGMTTARVLRIDMLDLPFGIDGPARDHIHMSHWERGHRDVHPGRAPLGEHLVAGRLNIAGFVPGAALQNHWLAVPTPGHAEPGQRLTQHRRVKRRFAPTLTPVGRDLDFRNPTIARIGKARNLVEARLLQRQPRRGVGNEGLYFHREEELPNLGARHPIRVLHGFVDRHHRRLDE